MSRIVIGIIFVLFLSLPGICQAAEPKMTVEKYIDQVYELLKSKKAKESSLEKSELRQKLSQIALEAFDFRLMSRMILATHWKALNEQQHKEFVDLFIKLLGKNYFAKLEEYMSEIKDLDRQNISITDEILFSSHKAEVKSRIKYSDKDIPVNYRLVLSSSGWKVYDVSVEGVSLVRNYRDQFRDFMMKNSPEELIECLRKKIQEQRKDS